MPKASVVYLCQRLSLAAGPLSAVLLQASQGMPACALAWPDCASSVIQRSVRHIWSLWLLNYWIDRDWALMLITYCV